ncbi:MAG: GGDEF domain-containing phosphodiesterase, partial [Deltaproteobacteria bacterium]|nr:GGDEF domain-containing phosphodiesterase [Deltaproteobacteria bacterium]
TKASGAAVLVEKLRAHAKEDERLKSLELAIGIAEFPDHGDDSADILSAVDLATRAAKADELPLVTFRSDLLTAKDEERAAQQKLATQLRALGTSIDERQFRMVYQPIVASPDSIFAYEALVRPSNDAFAHPGELFGTAERAGKILALSRVLRELTVEPADQLADDVHLFINLHPLDLFDSRLLSGEEEGLVAQAKRVVLEVTEVAEIKNFERVREHLDILREFGFRIAVDDLGAGYSGLNNLALLNPDFVKLDMALVRGVDKSPRMANLIRHIVDFANCEGMKVIAEGVETEHEYATVRELGAHYYQGYYFARPSPPFCGISISE